MSATSEADSGDELAPSVEIHKTEDVETKEAIETEDVLEETTETEAEEATEDPAACEHGVEESWGLAEAADEIPSVTPQGVEGKVINTTRDRITAVTRFAPEVALKTCLACEGHAFFPGTRRDVCKMCLNV